MYRMFRAIGAAVIAFGIGFTAAVPVTAAPLMPVQVETKSKAETVNHRRWHRRNHYRHGYERHHSRSYGYRRHHRNSDYWGGHDGRRGYGHHRRHYPRFGIYFN
ncbi:hypothetical protein P6U16_15770 [Rhizobium sp. 32-5/1]|uniref:hypothetical protein n=1 Tax=Rhizobium sp. 32-5/1 TaxID=3019602 RepID=UPI00240E4A4F|nr:hypothetical protein [Rhizobium sp. 32-5/1]WEZ82534.1 hypothetical protein P6U16_15770 [Rhizobium sp. 32-5/1]